MKVVTKYENKKILVLGLAKSGFSAAKLLHQLGAIVTVNDGKKLEDNPDAQDLLAMGIRVITGGHPIELLDEDFALVVKNPGIPYNNPLVAKAVSVKLPVITEVELAYEICEAPIVGITGSNGKTTTTTMTHAVLNAGKEKPRAFVAGNIGEVASEVAQELTKDEIMVTELSSFQLMGIDTFKPKIAAIVNIFEAHLDYHGSRENYVAAKWEIQKNMSASETLILNFNQQELRNLSKTTKASVLPFSTQEELTNGVYTKDGGIYFKGEFVLAVDDIGVPGSHNVENALVAIAIGKLNGVANGAIKQALMHFAGVEHRMEYVGDLNGRKVYNDSKATNILATQTALEAFKQTPETVVLIAGGLDRGNDFKELESSFKGLKAVVLFGEAKEKLACSAQAALITQVELVDNLAQATQKAYELSDKGDTLLFSPACASWDQFTNFEIRGAKFKEYIHTIRKSRAN